MIALEMPEALMLYLGTALLLLFGVWVFFTYKDLRRKRPPVLFGLAVCSYCDFPYLAKTIYAIHRCPRCGLLNEKNWYRSQKRPAPTPRGK